MNEVLEKSFKVRYVKLHFTIEFVEDSILPVYKTSALRGGMGEMLLRSNCIADRDCDNCGFERECIVRRTMYSQMEIQPSFMTSGDSVGYVIECEDYHEQFSVGARMQFNLILFGKTIVYFSQFLNAFYALGMSGIGKEQAKFRIVSVTGTTGVPILEGNDVVMSNYQIKPISDYVAYRRKQLGELSERFLIRLKSPLSIKFRGNELSEFNAEAFIESACRRIYMLDCFEGIQTSIHEMDYIEAISVPKVISANSRKVSVRRYSDRHGSAMYLRGFEGTVLLEGVSEDLMDILLAGELLHIGKNTSFGFGRYRVSKE